MKTKTEQIIAQSRGRYTTADAAWLDKLSDTRLDALLAQCPECDGSGWTATGPAHAMVRCQCYWQRNAAHRLKDAEIPPKYAHCTFENFEAYTERLARALRLARGVADAFPNPPALPGYDKGHGLLLCGQAGVGKSHLAVSILRTAILNTGCSGLFIPVAELLKRIRSSYNPTTMAAAGDVLTPALTYDILVLDDIGAERMTDWVGETMNLIVDTRYRHSRMTLFTTNYLDFPDDTDPNSLVLHVGYRIRSRLYEMVEFVEMDGGDYRNRPHPHDVDDLKMLHEKRKGSRPETGHGRPRPARAHLGDPRGAELKWPGGRGGNT